MKKVLVLISVAAVLFSSGCVYLEDLFGSGEAILTSYGLRVNEFGPDFSELETGDKFDLYLEVENTGGSTATGTYAHLYDFHTESKSLGNLEPPDELAGMPGDIKDETWELTVPSGLPEGVVYQYTPRVRLMYGYKTIATANLPALTKTEYKRLKERGQLDIPPISTDVSKGPLAVSISARSPIIIEDFNDDTIEFRVNIDLLGRGTLLSTSHSTSSFDVIADDLDKVNLKITASGIAGAVTDECDAYTTSNEYEEIDMRKGKSVVYSCELKASTFSASKNIPVTVELDYNYFEDFSTTLTVTGED